jgi:hypothetical protein
MKQCTVWVQVSHLWGNDGQLRERSAVRGSARRKKGKENIPRK